MTALASALALLGGSVTSGILQTDRISAEGSDEGYYVDLESNYSNQMILLDGEYYTYNVAHRIGREMSESKTFIVPSTCSPSEDDDYHRSYSYYDTDEEHGSRIFVLSEYSVDAYDAENIIVSDGIMEIGMDAFSAPMLKSITIADSVIKLGVQSHFDDVVIRGHMGSLAENYAANNGNTFEYLGDVDNSSAIDAADILKLVNDLNGVKSLDEDESARADENYDAKLNIVDLIKLKSEIVDPRTSGIGASFDGAKAAPDLRHFTKLGQANADGYMKFAAKSASAVLLDTEDENGKENTVYSPLSYYMALSMAAECAEGNTKDEFIAALGAEDIDDLRKENDSLFRALYFDKYTAYCKIANSLWLNNKWTFKQDTLDTIADKYYAVSFERDFKESGVAEEISSWIYKNTSGKFKPQIMISDPELDIMKIVNTVTFKDAWSEEFGKADKDTFVKKDGTEVECDFMGYTKQYKDVGFADKYMRCSEPMKNGCQMHFILPDEGVSVDELVADAKIMNEIYNDDADHQTRKTIFSVPKFDVASKFELIEASSKLGIKDAFSDIKADFTGVIDYEENNIPSAYINEIKHEATVTIDEEGCEAAAYTIISFMAGCAPPPEEEPVIFELKRPFFYYISDEHGTPLFSGIINDPLEK